jgi:hypothetical protein
LGYKKTGILSLGDIICKEIETYISLNSKSIVIRTVKYVGVSLCRFGKKRANDYRKRAKGDTIRHIKSILLVINS